MVSLFIAGVVDNNGNLLIDRAPVEWSGIYESGIGLIVDQSSSEHMDYGQAHASFNLTREGQVTFSARIGEVESERLTITVQERSIPGENPASSTLTLEGDLETAIPTLLPESLETPVKEPLVAISPETAPAIKTEPPERDVYTIILILAVLIVVTSIILFQFSDFFAGIIRYIIKLIKKDFTTLENPRKIVTLIKNLDKSFNDEELRHLCVELGVDYDNLGGSGKKDRARELVTYLNRRGQIAKLLTALEKLRPNVSWR